MRIIELQNMLEVNMHYLYTYLSFDSKISKKNSLELGPYKIVLYCMAKIFNFVLLGFFLFILNRHIQVYLL